MLIVWKPDAKAAQKILDFFEQHPERNDCFVGIGTDYRQFRYPREDIPKLQKIIAEGDKESQL